MKKNNKAAAIEATATAQTKETKMKKQAAPIKQTINDEMKPLRKSLWSLLKMTRDVADTTALNEKIREAFKPLHEAIAKITAQATLMASIAKLSDEEREALKQMLNAKEA